MIREIHAILLKKGRGSDKDPEGFRRSQNWIGGTRPGNAIFVPPPEDQVSRCMGDLEKFFHDIPSKTPVLIKCALSHVQFETIHPFLDGNGRVGRLLIPLLLCQEGILKEPLLYLSLYLKQHRPLYYDLLSRVRTDGDWESWVSFFVDGIKRMAESAILTAKKLLDIADTDRHKIQKMGRKAGSALRIHQAFLHRPLVSISFLSSHTKLSPPTVTGVLEILEREGIIKEITGKRRNRIYAYEHYLEVIGQGTEV